jgi:hypothetical protein
MGLQNPTAPKGGRGIHAPTRTLGEKGKSKNSGVKEEDDEAVSTPTCFQSKQSIA